MVQPSPALPARVDVAIIGGGVIGVCTAYELAKRGIAVAVFEKGRIAGEQSSRNWGFCRQQGRDPVEIPLAVESLRIWRDLDREIGRETGFRQAGLLYVTDKEADIERWRDWLTHAEPFQIGSRLLSASEVAERVPQAHASWRGGLWTAADGKAEPTLAVPAIAEAVKERGGLVFPGCAVRGLDQAGGRVSGVVTEKGRVAADTVVLAGGAWSRLFCKRHGIALKSLNVRASVLRTSAAPDLGLGGISGPDFSLRRRLDGGYTVARSGATTYDLVPDGLRWMRDFWPAYQLEKAKMKVRIGANTWRELRQRTHWEMDEATPFEATRVLDPRPDYAVLRSAFRKMRASLPSFGDVRIEETWGGMIDATPDAVPIISPVASHPGLLIASGFSGHGFGIGPGAGRLAADLVTGASPCVDPSPFAITRFYAADGAAPFDSM
ncbi:MAG: FAD-dependent oxidoreductase [Rhizobiales bacterium]|nr:FAD-dependent oxidoreductase [Hyphomicrobiales bacterium]